jgi:hypothetical protein
MSITTQETITVTPNRTCRIVFDKPQGQLPSITTIDEKVIGDIHQTTGNMYAMYDAADPLDIALYAAIKAKLMQMRAKRDEVKISEAASAPVNTDTASE